jgi:hypothetical protein
LSSALCISYKRVNCGVNKRSFHEKETVCQRIGNVSIENANVPFPAKNFNLLLTWIYVFVRLILKTNYTLVCSGFSYEIFSDPSLALRIKTRTWYLAHLHVYVPGTVPGHQVPLLNGYVAYDFGLPVVQCHQSVTSVHISVFGFLC